MAFRGLGISTSASKVVAASTFKNGFGYNVKIYPSTTAPTMHLQFGTEQTTCTTFNLVVRVAVVKKYANASGNQTKEFVDIGTAGAWIDPTHGAMPASSFTVTGNPGAYLYSIPFANVPNLASMVGALGFASRSYDNIRLTIELRGFYDGGSIATSAVCFIGFFPVYTPSGAWIDYSGNLILTFNEASWMRVNDRWQVDQDIKVGSNVLVKKGVWGPTSNLDGVFWQSATECGLTIPKEKLQFTPTNGAQIATGRIRFAGAWQPATGDYTLNYLTYPGESTAGHTIVNNLQKKTRDPDIGGEGSDFLLNTPTITAVRDGHNVRVTVNQIADGDTPLTYIEVQMVGGITAFDTATLAPGESKVFYGVPYGVPTTWQATGYYARIVDGETDLYQGKSASATVPAIPAHSTGRGTVLVNQNGDEFNFVYNVDVSRSSEPEHETLKFAGRSRPSVAYGEGGEVKWKIDADVFIKAAPDNAGVVVTCKESELIEMPMNGPWLVRDEEGNRYVLNITDLDMERKRGELYWRGVSITAEEVA